MSLLRVCAFAKCLSRRSLLERCAVRVCFADSGQLCVSRGTGAVRRISGESKESVSRWYHHSLYRDGMQISSPSSRTIVFHAKVLTREVDND